MKNIPIVYFSLMIKKEI